MGRNDETVAASLALTAIVAFSPHAAHAQNLLTTIGLFSTGVGSGGAQLTEPTVDTHYTFEKTAGDGGNPVIPLNTPGLSTYSISNSGFPLPPGAAWVPVLSTDTSTWILPTGTDRQGNNLDTASDGVYFYTTTFDLTNTNVDPSKLVIKGEWTTDNAGANIFINPTGMTASGPTGGLITGYYV